MARLGPLISQSVRRNKRDFALSSIGVVVGISTLLFFTALGTGVKHVVLERVFVIGQLEVEPPSVGLSLFDDGPTLNDNLVEQLRKLPGVSGVYPKMKLTFPTSVKGGAALIGKDIRAELIADGIPASLIQQDVQEGAKKTKTLAFKDWDSEPCDDGQSECLAGYSCGSENLCEAPRCESDDACGEGTYCDNGTCQIPIPVVVNPALLEIYNGSIHTALKGASGGLKSLPKLSADGLIGLEFTGVFGKSYLGKSAKGRTVERRMRLVGFSPKAINLGVTMPIGYVRRLNQQFRSEAASKQYHSILVDTESNDRVAEIAKAITEMGYALSDKHENAQRAGLLILLMTMVFNLISLIILAIAAVNIMHTFLMIVLERRRELAVMRAVGATRSNIRFLVLGEAALLGLIGSLFGTVLGLVATTAVDFGFVHYVADFPFKPESLFVFEPWMFVTTIGVGIFFCLVGAAIPAHRASTVEPAAALSGH